MPEGPDHHEDEAVVEPTEAHYTDFDPGTIDPEVPPPDPVETTSDEVPTSDEVAAEPLPSFDPRYTEEFDGLLYIGSLTSTFRWFQHDFQIRSLRTDELLKVATLIRPYQETLADAKAYQTAVVAACVMLVDGQPLPLPLDSTDPDAVLAYRFDWVRRKWFPPVLDAIYEEYLKLENKVAEVLAAAGN